MKEILYTKVVTVSKDPFISLISLILNDIAKIRSGQDQLNVLSENLYFSLYIYSYSLLQESNYYLLFEIL